MNRTVGRGSADEPAGPRFLLVGQIIRPHGVGGEVRVEPYTDVPERFEWLESIFVGDPPVPVGIESVRYHQNLVLLRLRGDDSRDAAEMRRGQSLYVTEDQAIPLEEGEYFLHDLIGLTVVDEAGNTLGTLDDILETGANNVFVVRNGSEELLLPDIPDVIIDILFDEQRLIARLLPGMRDTAVK